MKPRRSSPQLLWRVSLYPEFWILLVLTLAVLPTRLLLARTAPALDAILMLALLTLPGSAAVCLFGGRGNWVERLVLAFVASLAILGIPAQAAIFTHANISAYMWALAVIVPILVIAAIVKMLIWAPDVEPEDETDRTPVWLIAAIVVLAAGLLYLQLNSHMDGDQFDNLAWIQGIAHDAHIFQTEPRFDVAPVSPRFLFSAWFVHQAMMSIVAGLDPVDLVGPQQLPLILMTLAAMYYLARRVAGRKDTAAWIVAIWAFYLLLWNQGTVSGYEVIVRSSLDKVVGGFIVLPVGVGIVLDYFNRPERKTLLWMVFAAIAGALTHPITGALFGLALAGFALIELAMNRDRRTFAQLVLVTAILLVSLTSSFYLLAYELVHPSQGLIATSLTDTRDPSLSLEIGGAFDKERIFIVGNGYILHPRLILQLIQIPAFLALPILFRRMKRSRSARLLFGMIVFVTLVLVIPPTAEILGTLVTPSLLYRLAWPLSIAAVLTVGWLSWDLLTRFAPRHVHALGLASLVVVGIVGAPQIKWNLTWLSEFKANLNRNYCVQSSPLLRPFQTMLTNKTVVLGDSDATDFCLVAYAHNANVVEFHGTNGVRTFIYTDRVDEGWQRLFDAEYYHNAEFVDNRLLSIFKRWNVGYVIVALDSPLEPQLAHLPANFRPVLTAIHRRVYQVVSTDSGNPVIAANSILTAGKWADAQTAYHNVLAQGSADDKYLASIGLGRALSQTGQVDGAIAAWQQAATFSNDAQAYALMGEGYFIKHDLNSALHAYQQAAALPSVNGIDEIRLGDMYQYSGQSDQAEQAYQIAAAETTAPGTSVYYNQLGQFWSNVGATDRALAAFAKSNQIYESGDTYQLIGQTLETVQRWQDAEQAFRKEISLDLWDWSGHTDLGALYSMTNDYGRATSEYLTSLRLHPLNFAPYQGLADVWSSQVGQPEALRQLQALVGYRLGFGPALSAASVLYDQSGNYALAVKDAQRAISWYRLGIPYYAEAAAGQLDSGNLPEAATAARQALDLDSGNTSAYLALAQIAMSAGDTSDAHGYMLQSAMVAPYGSRPQLALAGLLAQQDQPAQALATYQAATAVAVDKEQAWIALGQYQLQQGQLDQATQSFNTGLKLLPSATLALRGIGLAQQYQGQVPQATDTFSQTVHLQPGNGANRQALGDLLIQQGRVDDGIEQLRQAVTLDTGDTAAYVDLGDILARQGRVQDADGIYRLLTSNLTAPEGYLGLAQLAERKGQVDQARTAYGQAIASAPKSASGAAEVAFGQFEARQGASDQAVAHFKAAIAQQPVLDAGYVALARLYLARADYAAATAAVRQGLTLIPASSSLYETLGAIQVAQGNLADGEISYRKALSVAPADESAMRALAELYAATGHPDAALGQVSGALARRPGDTNLLIDQVNLDVELGQPGAAVTAGSQLTGLAAGLADAWIANAQALANQGQISQALDGYRKATQLEPGNAGAWVAYAKYLADQAKNDEAQAALAQGLETDQGNVDLHLTQVSLLLRQGQAQQATAEYSAAAKLDATNDTALLALAAIDRQAGRLPAAEHDSTLAMAAAPADAEAYRSQAEVSVVQGQFDQARQVLSKATNTLPGSCQAQTNFADFLSTRGEFANAESAYRQALKLTGCAISAHVGLGNLYLAQAKPAEAIDQFRQAIAANPGDAFAYAVLGSTLTMQLRWNEANSTFATALTHAPASDMVAVAKGRSLIAQGKLQEAQQAMKKATDLNPSNAMDWIGLGNAAQVLSQLDAAESSYTRAATVDHSVPDPQIALGDLYARQARNDQAQAAYARAVEIAPGDPRTYNSLGSFFESLNQNDQAIAAFRQGIAADKSQIESLLYLGREYQRLARIPEAQQVFQQAVTVGATGSVASAGPIQFSSAVTAPSIAQAYIGLGSLAKSQADSAAVQYYQKAVQIAPADPNGYINLGLAYLAQGRRDDAQAQFQMAARVNPVSAQAYVALGDLYQSQADQVAAQQAYVKAIGVSPASAIGYITLGRSLDTQGQKDQATAQLNIAGNAAPASAPVYVALGDINRSQANWPAAEQAYLKAMDKTPRDANIYIGLGDVYEAQTQWDQAIAQFQKAATLDPASAQGPLALGALYRERADWKSAESAYKAATTAEPANPLGFIGLGQTYLVQGMTAQAEAQFLAATVAAPAQAQAYSAQGDYYRLQNDWKSAENAYRQAIKVEVTNPLGYIGLGLTLQAEGQGAKALEQFQTAVKMAPASAQAYVSLGDWYTSQADWKNAQAAFKKAIQIAPTSALGYVSLAHALELQGLNSDAEAQLQAGIDNAPTAAEPYVALGNLYQLEAKAAAAGQTYQQATTAIPTSSKALVALGDWYQSQDKSTDAEQAYKQAISVAPAGEWQTGAIEPPDLSAYIRLGSFYQAMGRNSDALQQLKSASQIAPSSGAALVALGNWFLGQADQVSAEQAYQQAIKMEPGYTSGYVSLGQLYGMQGRPTDAATLYRSAISANPGDGDLLKARGDWELQRGEIVTATLTYQQAVKVDPTNLDAWSALAKAYEWQGQYQQAEKTMNDTVALAVGSPEPYVTLGDYYAGRQNWDAAVSSYREALKRAPQDPLAHEGIVKALLFDNQPKQAVAEAQQWVKNAAPGDSSPWLALGVSDRIAGDLAGSIAAWQQITGRWPGDVDGYLGLAATRMAQGQFQNAASTLDQAMAYNPGSVELYLQHGLALEVLGQTEAARADYRRAAILDANLAGPLLSQAGLLTAQYDQAGAIALLQQAVNVDPTNVQAYLELANIYLSLNRNQDAVNLMQGAVSKVRTAYETASIDPTSKVDTALQGAQLPDGLQARLALAQSHSATYDPGGALKILQDAMALYPDQKVLLLSQMAQVYSDSNDVDTAHKLYQQAQALDPNSITPLMGEGELYQEKQKEFTKAIDLYEKAAKIDGRLVQIYQMILSAYGQERFGKPTLHIDCSSFPEGVPCRPGLGDYAIHSGIDSNLEAKYKAMYAADPNSVANNIRMAMFYEAFTQASQAIGYWQQVIKLDPTIAEAYLRLGRLEARVETERLSASQDAGLALAWGPDLQQAHNSLYGLYRDHLSSPDPNGTVRGILELTGTADSDPLGDKTKFDYYKLEISSSAAPAARTVIATSRQAVVDGTLGFWDTTTVPNGIYTLRLTVVDVTGNYGPWQEISIQVAN